jgi:hypothetical protein
MAQFEISGYRRTRTPEGRVIIQVPVSVSDDSAGQAPPAPEAGLRLVSNEYTQRPDGGRDYTYTYESNGSSAADGDVQIAGQAAQEPIETHPKFNGQSGYGTVIDSDLAAIKSSLASGTTPAFTGTGLDLQAAQDLYNLMLKGVTHYYVPSGITYSESFDESSKPSLIDLCTKVRPPADAPTLRATSDWLLIGMRAQKQYEADTQTFFWRVTREWLASGPRGWNADFPIYEV